MRRQEKAGIHKKWKSNNYNKMWQQGPYGFIYPENTKFQ